MRENIIIKCHEKKNNYLAKEIWMRNHEIAERAKIKQRRQNGRTVEYAKWETKRICFITGIDPRNGSERRKYFVSCYLQLSLLLLWNLIECCSVNWIRTFVFLRRSLSLSTVKSLTYEMTLCLITLPPRLCPTFVIKHCEHFFSIVIDNLRLPPFFFTPRNI